MKEYKCKVCGSEISEFQHIYDNDMCYHCRKEEWDKNEAEMLQKNLQTTVDYADEIVCPYCGYRMADDYGYFERQGNGEEKCSQCRKIFNFEVNIEVTYSTSRKEEQE